MPYKLWLTAISLLFAVLSLPLHAGSFPSQPLTIIVPNAPGGGTDITTRGLARIAEKYLPVPIRVVNRSGASGIIGTLTASRAKPDGYTLVMATVELAILPHLRRSPMSYKNFDFLVAPIAEPGALIVNSKSPFNSVADFMAYARQHPGRLRVGNSGIGSIWHLSAMSLKEHYGVEFVDVPYSGGSAEAIVALVGGHIDAVTVGPANATAQIAAGQLKLLGVMNNSRMPLYPDVPTFQELGADLVIRAWAALGLPKGVPEADRQRLQEAFSKALQDSDYQHYMARQGIVVNTADTAAVNAMIQADDAFYKTLVEGLGVE